MRKRNIYNPIVFRIPFFSSTASFNQSQQMTSSDNKKGIDLDYDSKIVNTIDETFLNYKVEYTKSFQEANGFRTFTVISMELT